MSEIRIVASPSQEMIPCIAYGAINKDKHLYADIFADGLIWLEIADDQGFTYFTLEEYPLTEEEVARLSVLQEKAKGENHG